MTAEPMDARGGVRASFERYQRVALSVGILAAAAVGYGFVQERATFFRAWLVAFLYWLALPLGSLALVMLHHLTGGSWGFAIRRLLEASMRTLPAFVLLFVPIALGMHDLYEWTHAEVVARDPILHHKSAYLNTTGFLVRAGLYFAIWLALARRLDGLSRRYDRFGGSELVHKMRVVSGPGIALYGLALTFAAVDWAMSLEPHWFSTIYGVMILVGQALATLAFAIVVSAWLAGREPFSRWIKADHHHDLGKLLFTFVLLWAYVAYSQYLIIWSANLAEETPWYLNRSSGGWQSIAVGLIAFHFVAPFLLLLSRKAKRDPRALAAVALFILFLRLVDLVWLIVPAFEPGELRLHWLYAATPVAIGGLWLALFLQQLKGRPLISLQDAHLEGALEGAAPGLARITEGGTS